MVMGTAGAAQADHKGEEHGSAIGSSASADGSANGNGNGNSNGNGNGNGNDDFKVAICHATGSESNPYENGKGEIPKWQITDPHGHGVADHANHGDDIIPAFDAGSHGNKEWPAFGGLNTHLLSALDNDCELEPDSETPPSDSETPPSDSETPPSTDVCPNLDGVQETVPNGYVLAGGSCTAGEVAPTEAQDVCPNLAGVQESVPNGMVLDGDQCVKPAQPDEVLGTQQAVPTVVDAGLGGPAPTSGSTADLVGKSLVAGGLVLLVMAALMQVARLEHGVHEA